AATLYFESSSQVSTGKGGSARGRPASSYTPCPQPSGASRRIPSSATPLPRCAPGCGALRMQATLGKRQTICSKCTIPAMASTPRNRRTSALQPNKRLKLSGARVGRIAFPRRLVFVSAVPTTLRQRALRPQLKRDPLGARPTIRLSLASVTEPELPPQADAFIRRL